MPLSSRYHLTSNQTVYLTNDNIFSVEAYFASYQGFSVFFAIVSIGSLLCFSLVFLVNSYVLEYLAKFIHLIWRFIFKRKMAWLTPRVWKGWILVAVAVGYAFGQVKWISLLGVSTNYILVLLIAPPFHQVGGCL
jgi:hypothetical protein